LIVIRSNSADVYENLAAEDVLLDDASRSAPVVFIYRNDSAVVIGKNQNPWRECAVSRLGDMGVKLARRVSGGGTVYHDPGNINISCILPRESYRRADLLDLFIKGLASLGVAAEVANSTSLVVGGRKISGNAFCYRRDKVLHHGTFLWRADLEKLKAALVPDIAEMETRAVASVRMPVMNLSDVMKQDGIADAILSALAESWGAPQETAMSPFAAPDFISRVERMKSWDWLFGATPDFRVNLNSHKLDVHRGVITATGERFFFQ
jgi:lipoate-protein ligase A